MSRTLRYLLIGLATFIVCLALFAPATPIKLALQRVPGLSVGPTSGSLWRGSAPLSYHDHALGQFKWAYRIQDLLRLRLGYAVRLEGPDQRLEGHGAVSLDDVELMIRGEIDSTLLTDLLGRYDISITGTFSLARVDLTLPHGGTAGNSSGVFPAIHTSGEIHWSGGPIRYRLGNSTRRGTLPALVAYLDSPSGRPGAAVYRSGDDTPLILASIQPDGWASIGITRQFTELVGHPWSGNQPAHAVVMEVQEKLF